MKEPTDYIFALLRNEEHIDDTSLDENNPKHAEWLFYNEFGHKKQKGDKIVLVDTE